MKLVYVTSQLFKEIDLAVKIEFIKILTESNFNNHIVL